MQNLQSAIMLLGGYRGAEAATEVLKHWLSDLSD